MMRRKQCSLGTSRRNRTTRPAVTRWATFGRRPLRIEHLEDRRLLDASMTFTHIIYNPGQGAASSGSVAPADVPLSSPSPVGLTPTQIRTAYGVNLLSLGSITGDGTGQTIAIIDAYDDPALVSSTSSSFSSSDLHKFDVQFGLPDPPSFTKLNENGGTSYPAPSGSSGWSVEESLDVEWAHVLAPGAKIVLIEANSPSSADLVSAAVNTARNLAGVSVVSMSFGTNEFSGETSYDANFTTPSGHQGVTFVASTGDDGAPGGYPAYSPNVVAAGGTTLTLSGNNYGSETGWSGSGGGPSVYESRPSYQNSVQTSAHREIPDVAFDADPNSGVAVYDSYDYGSSAPWLQVGGTSVAAPCWAGLLAITNQIRVAEGMGTLDGPSQTLPQLYGLPAADFHDITSGSNGYPAGPGYDMVTGRGSPVVNKLIPDLAPYEGPMLTVASTHIGTFKQGDAGDTYTITVSNKGTAATSGTVSLVDALPAGLMATAMSGAGWTVNLSTLTATRSDPLATGGSYSPLTVTVNVAANAPPSVTNTVTVSGDGESNTASDVTSIVQAVEMTVAMSDSGNFKEGDIGDTYTITATNVGFLSTSSTVSVVDMLPAGITATAMTGLGWNVNLSTLTATRSDPLAAGGSYSPLTLTVNVAANAPASVTNAATVSGGGENNTTSDTASDVTAIQQPDLAVAATHSGTFSQGDFGDAYTIAVSNVGLSATNAAVSVVDTLPAGLTATAMTGSGWTVNLSTLTATRSDPLAAGGSYPPLTVTVNVAGNAPISVTNTATVSGGGETNTSNDTASDVTTIQQPDLAVTATNGSTFQQDDVGDAYTITVSNVGLAPTKNSVSLSDSLPAGLTATGMTGSGWNINFATLTATRSDPLAAGGSYPPLTVTVDVAANAPASVTDKATVSGGGETNTANDTSSDTTAITQLPDLTVASTHNGTFSQGDTGDTYTITVSNVGAGPTSGTVSLVDTLPTGLTATAMSGTGWNVNLSTLTATRSDSLAAGSSYPVISLTVNVAANAPTSLTNTATVSGGGEVSTGNDIATDVTGILNASGPPSILSVTPALSGGMLVAGSTTTLAINFSEVVVGGGTAANYQLQSAGPDGLLGTADDVSVPLSASYSGTTATLSFTALTPGIYRLTVFDTITDTSGNKLDGNGDGLPGGNFSRDFVVVPALSNSLFGTPSTFSIGGSPISIVVGDFNGDGIPDIALVNSSGSSVSVLLGNGSGGFSSPVTYSSGGSGTEEIAAGDFNGDGKIDLAVTNYWSNNVGVLMGNGDGTFAPVVTYNSGGSSPYGIAVADVNHDGKQDLVVTNDWSNNVAVLLGNGDGTFAAPATYPVVNSFPICVAVGDFNGDGYPDLAVGVAWGNVDVLLNNGNGTFAPAVVYGPNTSDPTSIAVGDFNGDGKLDLAVANSGNNSVSVLLGNGNGTFSTDTTYSTGGTMPESVAVGDFNKDGIQDLAVTNSGSGTVGVLLGKGNGTFAAATTYSSGGSSPYPVADYDANGSTDLVVGNQFSDTVSVLPRVFVPASVTLDSPGRYNFDVQEGGYGAGQLIQGTADAFDGMDRLQVGGADYSPSAVAASITDNGQTVLLGSQTLAGLTVSREVTVPDAGGQDFARTIDSFQNTTANSITATVTILGNLGSDAATTVFATSDGTGVVSPTDQWIGTDDAIDGGGTPAVISCIHGPTGLMPASVSLIGDNLAWTYSLTVPAGQTVRLATFTIQSMSRATAIAEANALVTAGGLGGEAGLLLTPAESASLLNFDYGAPSVLSTSVDEGVLTSGNDSITVAFNEAVLGSGAAANYQLQSAGPDGLLGTSDDITIPITSVTAGNQVKLNFGSLPPGIYRLTVLDSITDLLGNGLDGNGQPGSNFTRDFVVVPQPVNSLFGTASTFNCGGIPTSMVVGDFNGDGTPDIAVANDNDVVVLLGNGAGGFAAPVTYSSGGTYPDAIVAGDFNGDGKLDLAVTNYFSNTIGVLLGNGDGTFANAVTYGSGGSYPDSIAVSDFNGDGKQDIAVGNWGSNDVGVLLGNGDGTFSAAAAYGSGGSVPESIAVGDFNGDGKQDIAVANWTVGNTIGVLLGNGDGTFAPAVTYNSGGYAANSIVAGDFNGDGKLDLAVLNVGNNCVGVLLGNGDGTFSAATTYSTGGATAEAIAVGDVNKDGIPDLAVTNYGSGTVGVLLGNGDGTFAAATTYSTGGNGPYGVTIADLNGDGYSDLAVANQSSGTVSVLPRVFVPASVTLASPGGYDFDVQYGGYGSGQLIQGTANAFDGFGRLRVGGADYAPAATAANLTDNGQSVLLPAQTMAGLTVSREVSVPTIGSLDFARTVDSFQNSTANSITTTVTILGNLGSDAATTVFATSDGTGVVSPNDEWIGTDDAIDGGGTPAVISFIHGPAGLAPSSVSLIGDNITWTYSLTVPAGQTVSLASFTIQSMSRATAIAEANALTNGGGFCPQAALLLAPPQLAALANFQFPGPNAIQLSATSVDEKQAVGTLVGTLSSTDTQSGATFTYSLPQSASYPDNAAFSIDANGNLRTAAVLNAQTQSSYTILVQSTDQYGYWFTKSFTIAVNDITPPSVVLDVPGTSGPINATSLVFSVVFSETVYNLAAADFQLITTGTAAGTVTSVSAASGTIFTVTVGSITGDGTMRLDLMAGTTVEDAAGNAALPYTSGGTVTLQHTPPTVLSSTPSTPGPTTANSLAFTIVFSETVYAVDLGDFQLSPTGSVVGTMTSLSANSGTSYTIGVAGIDGAGTLRLDLKSGSTILDAAGNVATGYQFGDVVWLVDTPATVTSITPNTVGPTNATSLTYSVVFSKNVYNVRPADFQLTATGTATGMVTNVSAASGSSFTVTVGSIAGDGTLRLDLLPQSVQDIAAIDVPAYTSGGITTVDNTPPAVLSDTPSTPGPTTANSVTFSVVFSKPVYDVIPGDFQVTGTGSAVGTATSVSAASGTGFTVTVAGIDGSGTLRLDLNSGSTIEDDAGNVATGYASGDTVTVVDTPAFVTSITPSTAGPTNATSLTYSVVFNKNVYDVAAADFQLTATGTAAGTVTGVSAASGSSITVTVGSITGDGTLRLDLLSGSSVQDIAGASVPGYTSGGTTTFQHTPPAVLSSTPSTTGPTNATSLGFTVVFSETVSNVVPADFQVTTTGTVVGAVATVSAASGTSFTVTVGSILGIGTLRLDLKAGTTIQDAAGNVATGYTSGSTVSILIPVTVAAITPGLASGVINAGTVSLAVGFSQAVLGGGAASNFELQSAGADGLLGTSDDTTIPLAASYSGTTTTLNFSALAVGLYRLTAYDSITDTGGNKIDGDRDGQPGGNWVHDFVVVPLNTATFPTSTTLSTGIEPVAIATGDFNGDGKLDLVTANAASNSISVFIGNGAGGFAAPVTYATGGSFPDAVAVGDFNGDGKLDLVVANEHSGTVAVLLGNGNGTFGAATVFSTGGSYPDSLAVGDFNGDGKLDVVVANYGSENVSVLLGNGNGTFGAAKTSFIGGSFPESVAVGDFNGDGKLDLAVANESSNTVSVLLGNGNGTFAAATTFSSGGYDPDSVAVGDFNGDGKLDIAVTNSGGYGNVGVLLGDGAGGFAAATTFSSGGPGTELDPVAVAVGDFNGDGNLDLAVANCGSNTVGILLGNGSGSFSAATTFADGPDIYSLAVGDFNGDGKLDLAVTSNNSTVSVFVGNGNGEFGAAPAYPCGGPYPYAVAVGDFNGDGKPDLAVANYYGNTVTVLSNSGNGEFAAPYMDFSTGGSYPDSVAVGDFNGDGKLDLAVANFESDTVSVLLGNGSGGFATPVAYSTGGSGPTSVVVGDFNGDGKLDLAVVNYFTGTVGVLLGNGLGGFATAVTYSTGGSYPDSIAVGDFNGDGKLDLVVANKTSNTVAVLLGNGNGTFAAAKTFYCGGWYPESVVVGDFNGDSNLDIAVANESSDTVGVLLGNGSGGFAAAETYGSGVESPDSVAVADFNGDGTPDIVVADYGIGSISVLLGNGSGGFNPATIFSSGGNNPQSLAVGDFNGDGKSDLAVANYGSNTVGVLLNSTSPVVRPLTSVVGTTYQVQSGGLGAGQIAASSNALYNGMGRLRVSGQDYTPPLATSNLINANSTVVTPTVSMAGLYVSRKVTVPTSGSQDFVRTVDTFQNPSARPITTTVTILGNLGSDAATTVFATSDGTGVVSPNDQWIGTDDGSGGPAVITYLRGPLGLVPTSVRLVGDNITWTYNLTVPAGQTVELAYFTIVGATRAAAIAAANTLVTPTAFGGHAADYLSGIDLAALANFVFYIPTATTFTTSSVTGIYGGSTNATACLTVNGQPLANETLSFLLNGATVGTATTDATGTANLANISLSGLAVGTYAGYVSVSFAGDATHWQSNAATNLTVNQAPLLVTANNQVMVYGAALPTFTASYSGFVNGDTSASLTTLPTLTTTATTTSPVGSYEIDANGAVDPNYSITYAPGTLTITTDPEVSAMLVENGLTERSYVDQLTFEFNKPMISTAAVPMTLTDFGTQGNLDQPVTLTASQFQWVTVPGTGASVLTWSLESFAGGTSSLPDGYYELRLPSGLITDTYGFPLDGAGSGQPGGDYVADFFVLQGDVNGDGVVDNNDVAAVATALSSRPGSSNWNPNADLDRDGTVTTSDQTIVNDNLNNTITPPAPATQVTPAVPASLPAWSFDGSTQLTSTNNLPIGSPVNGIRFNADAGAFVLNGNAVELNGDIADQSPKAQTINLPLTLIGGSRTIDTGSGNVTIAGSIGQSVGGLGITKVGSGTLVLSGANTYSGTTVLAGVLQVTNSAALLEGSSLTVGAGSSSVFGSGKNAAMEPSASNLAAAKRPLSVPAVVGQIANLPHLWQVGNLPHVADSLRQDIAEPTVAGVQASPVSPAVVASPAIVVSSTRRDYVSRQVANLSHRAHDAVLQSYNARSSVEDDKAAAFSDLESSLSNGQADRKHDPIETAVDAVMAVPEGS